jgi:hypothetical protein
VVNEQYEFSKYIAGLEDLFLRVSTKSREEVVV